MVKHQKEKLYYSTREYRQNNNNNNTSSTNTSNNKLPFHCCALSLNPFTNPILLTTTISANSSRCSSKLLTLGVIFDKYTFIEHVLQHGTNPITGDKCTTRNNSNSNIGGSQQLQIDRNVETQDWQCPVLCKKFTDFSKIVAIPSHLHLDDENDADNVIDKKDQSSKVKVAYVLSYEAVQELNLKPNHMEHLITGEKFSKEDIIWLQDPDNAELCKLRDIGNFQYIQDMRKAKASSQKQDIRHSVTSSRVMNQVAASKAKEGGNAEEGNKKKRSKDSSDWASEGKRLNIFSDSGTTTSDGGGKKTRMGLTSTIMSKSGDIREPTQDEKLQKKFEAMKKLKKKGYVQLQTNLGNIMLEIDCDLVPQTCSNFLGLVSEGKYDGVKFHRCIKKFMIQCGSKKKDSYFGGAFKDEFDDRLTHNGRGIVAMANAGAHTNKDQFYITFGGASHLDRKHSVFGRVIDGFDVIDTMESIPTDKSDHPIHDIKIMNAEIAIDPSEEAVDDEIRRERAKEEAQTSAKNARVASALGTNRSEAHAVKNIDTDESKPMTPSDDACRIKQSVIGRYLPNATFGTLHDDSTIKKKDPFHSTVISVSNQKKKAKSSFGDFSSW